MQFKTLYTLDIYFIRNTCPHIMWQQFDALNHADTGVIVISNINMVFQFVVPVCSLTSIIIVLANILHKL